ncbi:Complex 1 protein (LYR family) [Ceratobasidium sp. AG-Ba]|nr:Complex 1 protein (LYR family) [Ceratobasidium sp. AG-Ba]QRW03922.1 Complex 1 protein (LYR family) [Ceratobasidium sp. AG-Ba]
MATQAQRLRAIRLYKELHRLGREYPVPSYDFNGKLRRAYERNRNLTDPVKINSMLDLAEHVKNETLALYSLSKYRHLKRSYSNS